MADRPHYIATTNRTVTAPSNVRTRTSLTPTTTDQTSDELLKYIRQKARHAADYYTTVGLSNGDLVIRNPHTEHRTNRRSVSPDKALRSTSAWNQQAATTPSKYGANWVKPRSRPTSKETDISVSYTLPSSTRHSTSSDTVRTERSKSRSKSASFDRTAEESVTAAGTESTAAKTVPRSTRFPAYVTNDEVRTGSLERHARGPTRDERLKSSSLTRMGKTAYFPQDNTERLNDLPRLNSRLHSSKTSLTGDASAGEAGDKRLKHEDVDRSTASHHKVNDKSFASTPASAIRTEKSVQLKESDYQWGDSDAQQGKADAISSGIDSASSSLSKTKSRGYGSASSLDQALANNLSYLDVDGKGSKTDVLSHSLPPSTKHVKKVQQQVDSNASSAASSANASPILPRKQRERKPLRSKSDARDHRILITNMKSVHSETDMAEGFRYDIRQHFAHHDWQSMLFSFRDVLLAMENLKRKNTTTGASKAAALAASNDSLGSKCSSRSGSMEDVSMFVDEDEGLADNKFNDLVASCPFFRNEIGGDQDRQICVDANNSTVSVQVGDSTTTEARNVLTNHTFLSVVEAGKGESLHPPGSPPNGSVSFGIEKRDDGAHYYRLYFFDKEHQNFFGIDEKHGPVVISLRREKIEEYGMVAYQYRVIVRTSELCTLRGSILEEVIHQPTSKHTSAKGLPPKEVLEYLCPEINMSCLKFAVATPKVHEQLVKVDQQNVYCSYKIGVLYCRAGQTTEEDMYNNEHGSSAFDDFLQILGQKVKLNGFNNFRGGLDIRTDSTGTESVFTEFRGYKIMFHVSTKLPFTPNNRQQLLRKRHIGNDIMTVVFQEPGSEPFSPKTIRSHFQHVFIIVRAYTPVPGKVYYRVAVTRSRNIPRFGPPIPENSMFVKSATFREFLLTKIINGENVAHTAGKFKEMAMNTRQEYLRDLCLNYATQVGLESNSKFAARFSISAASRRIRDTKEKPPKHRATPEIMSRGALTWFITVTDYSTSEILPCILGISDCVLTIVEIVSKQLIFSIPCQAVLGWSVPIPHGTKLDLHIYYGRGERVSLQTDDAYSRDDIIQRLERFTKGSETISRQMRRNVKGELGFHVNYEGIIMDVEPNGLAFQDGVTQSSRMVEICKVAVATMTHEEIIDLLRTSRDVKVVLIRPHDDGTPRKCSKELYHLAPILDVQPVPDVDINDFLHKRSRSEPANQGATSADLESVDSKHQRTVSYYASASKRRHDADTRDAAREQVKRATRKDIKRKKEVGDGKTTLLTTATKLAVVGLTQSYKPATTDRKALNDNQSSASNTLSSTKSTMSNMSSHSGADVDLTDCGSKRCGPKQSFLHSASSLSTDSGLNSNNNSSSTLSRASTDTPTGSVRAPAGKAPFCELPLAPSPLPRSSSNPNTSNNNNTFPGCFQDSPRRSSGQAQGEAIIRGVNWNAKPKHLGLNMNAIKPRQSYSVDCTPTSEVNQALRVYIAGTEAHKQARVVHSQASAPATPSTDELRSLSHANTHSVDVTPHQPSLKWWTTDVCREPSAQKNNSPKPKRRTIHNTSRTKNSAKSGATPYKQQMTSSASTDVQNNLIRLLAESPTKLTSAKRLSPTNRKSPVRSTSQRTSPNRRASPMSSRYLRNGSPGPRVRIQRTLSDESLCGARTDNLLHARQENFDGSPGAGSYTLRHSGSVDSLAPTLNRQFSDEGRLAPPTPIHTASSMLPLPVTNSWDRLLDAAKAAEKALTNDYLEHFDGCDDEVFEVGSMRSASMGTLNEIGHSGADFHSRSGQPLLAKRTMSVESLYDHEYRGNQGDPRDLLRKRDPVTPPSRPSLDLDGPFDYTRSVLTSDPGIRIRSTQPSESEQRLEKIERELRLLQDRLKKEQESKKKLEKEVSLLRRDNTRLQRHAFHSTSDSRHKRSKRKPTT